MFSKQILTCIFFVVIFQVAYGEDCDWTPEMVKQRCCNMPSVELRESMLAFQSCSQEMGIKPGTQVDRHAAECMEECVYKKLDIVSADNVIDMEKFIALLKERFATDNLWKSIVSQAFSNCSSADTLPVGRVQADSKCKSGSYQLSQCIIRDMFLNCPAASFKSGPICNTILGKVEKCPDILPALM